MNLKDEEIRVEATWRTNKPSSAWRRLVAKIFTGRKKKPADSHPEGGTNTAQDVVKEDRS